MSRAVGRAGIGILCLVALAAAIWWLSASGDSGAPEHSGVPGPVAGAGPSMPGIPPDAFEMTIESVHDGDTLRARVAVPNAIVSDTESTRVRLIGLDTPEVSPQIECWGGDATAGLTALLPPGSTVFAAADLEVRDRYGRHLLYLWTADGRFVNAELLARGDGVVMLFAPNTRHEDLFRALEAEAADAGRGLWGAC